MKTYWTCDYFLKLGFLFRGKIKIPRNIIVNFTGGGWCWGRLPTLHDFLKKTKHDIEFVII
jgi:hypothetical protein